MNPKYIMCTVSGMALGFISGYLFCSKRKEEYIHREIQDALRVAAEHMEKTGRPNPENPRVDVSENKLQGSRAAAPVIDNPMPEEMHETLNDYLKRVHAEDYIQPEDMQQLPDTYINIRGENKQQEMERRMNAKPGRIDKREFGQAPDHELVGFTLYSDGTLCDDADETVQNVESTIGCTVADLIDIFRVEDAEVLYFRNERTQLDIEITEDARKYEDVLKEKPYLKE